MRRLGPALLALLVLAPTASASTVSVTVIHEEEDSFITTVHVDSAAGERNTRSITGTTDFQAPRVVVVHDDTAPVTPAPGSGCTAVDSGTVRCELSDLDQLEADLGDMDDTASVSASSRIGYTRMAGDAGDDQLTCTWCRLEGGEGDDSLTGGEGSDDLHGDTGRDTMIGGGEGDSLYGGPDDDTMLGGDGFDSLYGGTLLNQTGPSGRDHLDGGGSADQLSDFDGSDVGSDELIGGEGADTVLSYLGRRERVFVDLAAGNGAGQAGENDLLTQIENVDGGAADDVLLGNEDANRIDGGLGDDRLDGRGGNDELISMFPPGNPLNGGPPGPDPYGPDDLTGGDGDDVIKTDTGLASTFTCDGGTDRIDLNGYQPGPQGTKPPPTPGPLVDRSCERIGMNRFVLDPQPVRVGRKGLLTFEFFAFRCCRFRFRLNRSTAPWRSYQKQLIRRRRVSVRAPMYLARRWRARPVRFRAKVDRAGDALFVWRFSVGGQD
jgi:hypothetical protein